MSVQQVDAVTITVATTSPDMPSYALVVSAPGPQYPTYDYSADAEDVADAILEAVPEVVRTAIHRKVLVEGGWL